jgi:hypothetical protein
MPTATYVPEATKKWFARHWRKPHEPRILRKSFSASYPQVGA